jgi:hypothetical protein
VLGVSSGTGLAPRVAGMSTLSSNATGSAPLEVDLEVRGARAGGKMFFMVDLRILFVERDRVCTFGGGPGGARGMGGREDVLHGGLEPNDPT